MHTHTQLRHRFGWALLVLAACWIPVSAQPITPTGVPEPLDGRSPLQRVPDDVLRAFATAHDKDFRPDFDIWCAVASQKEHVPTAMTDQVRAEIASWFSRAGVRPINKLANAHHELRQQLAVAERTPEALSRVLRNRTDARCVVVATLYPRAQGGPNEPDFDGVAMVLDLEEGVSVYERTFAFHSRGPRAASLVGASIARHGMKAYADYVATRPPERRFHILIQGLAGRDQVRQVSRLLEANAIFRGRIASEFETGEPSVTRLSVLSLVGRDEIIDAVEKALGALDVASEVLADSGRQITIAAGERVGLSTAALQAFTQGYEADREPEIKVLVGWSIDGNPDQRKPYDDRALAQGLESALTDELRRNRRVTIHSAVAQSEAQAAVIAHLQRANEAALASAVEQQLGNQCLAMIVAIQALPQRAEGDPPARLLVRLLDMRRSGQVISRFAQDWHAATGFKQDQIDQQSRRLTARIVNDYVETIAARPPIQRFMVQVAGLGQQDALADSMADVFSRTIRGVSGRVEVDPPRMVEGGETITTFRIAYDGDASQLRTALRQVFKAPLGMPSRFHAADEKTILVRVGDALEMPPWAVLTDAQTPADDPFVEQLRGTLERLGQPRIAVMALQRGSVAGIDLADLAGAVRAELGRARLDVIHEDLARDLQQQVLQLHSQFHPADTASAVMQLKAPVADLVVTLRALTAGSMQIDLLDVRNGRSLGSVRWPDPASGRNKAVLLDPANVADVGRYVAGSLLTDLARQEGMPNLTEVVIKNARQAVDVDAVAHLLLTAVPQVRAANQRSFAYGVGRFVLSYYGPFDGVAATLNEKMQELPFKVRIERSDRGIVEVYIEEGVTFQPQEAPAPAPAPIETAIELVNLPPVGANPAAAGSGAVGPQTPSGNVVFVQPAPAAAWTLPPQTPVANTPPAIGNHYAILVGIDQFEHPKSKPLRGSGDAIRLAMTLKQFAGYRDDHVILLTQGRVEADLEPTAENITGALRAVASAATPDDTILVAFSTHGLVNPETNETFICPSNEVSGRPLSAASIREILAGSKARASILVLDACQSGGRFERSAASPGAVALGAHREGTGLITLAGCQPNQYSLETPETNGVFTYFLCKGLSGEADRWAKGNKNGEIDLGELYIYTHDHVARFVQEQNVRDEAGRPVLQNPTRLGVETGEVILVRRAPGS